MSFDDSCDAILIERGVSWSTEDLSWLYSMQCHIGQHHVCMGI